MDDAATALIEIEPLYEVTLEGSDYLASHSIEDAGEDGGEP